MRERAGQTKNIPSPEHPATNGVRRGTERQSPVKTKQSDAASRLGYRPERSAKRIRK
jgi:hypothetical protein